MWNLTKNKKNKTKNPPNSEKQIRLRRRGSGELEEGGQKVQTSRHKRNKY